MPPKAAAGFTKQANKQGFVRHRDVKLKDNEVRKEQNIQHQMCIGVCTRCREKVQWRFKYDKYKPLKAVANCQGCKRKCVTKAYRSLCDDCATKKKVCSSCCKDMETENNAAAAEKAEFVAKKESGLPSVATSDGFIGHEAPADRSGEGEGVAMDEDDGDVEGEDAVVDDHDDYDDDDDDHDGDGEDEAFAADGDAQSAQEMPAGREVEDHAVGTKRKGVSDADSFSSMTAPAPGSESAFAGSWDERKFVQLASLKYSKDRKTGQEEDDNIFSFGK